LPMARKATSFREAWWSGWTCQNCGCKIDRYGKERDWRSTNGRRRFFT
jgi:hypothetical protein